MSLIDDASSALAPHTRHLSDTVAHHGKKIVEQLNELRRESDVGRPDTGDRFKFFIVRKKLPAEPVPINLATQVPNDDPGPTLGEVWLVQSICVNGQPPKSPGFAIRTNTGRLLFAVVPEGMGNETTGGSVVLLQGEVIIFEPLLEGTFDFTLSVILRKASRQTPDGGHGISEEHYERSSRAFEHEPERDFAGHSYVPQADDVGTGGDINPDVLGDGGPADGSGQY
jgi:hypothetical protein